MRRGCSSHWINAVAVLIMIVSGWRMYNADPFFGFKILNQLTLGGWLAGGVPWHFAAIWVLVVNGLIYLLFNGATCVVLRKLFVSKRLLFGQTAATIAP